MKLDLCVPAFNEEATILSALRQLRSSLPGDLDLTIIVAENGSTDDTAGVIERAGLPSVRVLRVQGKGKGMAIREAARCSTADVFGFIDADLSADPAAIVPMLERLSAGSDLVIGSRTLDTDLVHRGALRSFSSRAFNVLARGLLGVRCSDTQCGLKLMNAKTKQLLMKGTETGWFFDLELLAHGSQAGLAVAEVPVRWEEFRFPTRKSKLRVLRDGWQALIAMLRIRRGLRVE